MIRELKREHQEEIRAFHAELNECKGSFETSFNFNRILELEHKLNIVLKTIASIERFLTEKDKEEDSHPPLPSSSFLPSSSSSSSSSSVLTTLQVKQQRVFDLLPSKRAELSAIEEELLQLKQMTPSYAEYISVMKRLETFYEDIGLFSAQAKAEVANSMGGRKRNSRGKSFENTAESVLREHLVPSLCQRHNLKEEEVIVLRNVRINGSLLKGTSAELDCLICSRVPSSSSSTSSGNGSASNGGYSAGGNGGKPSKGTLCNVLAVIEVQHLFLFS